MAERRWAIGRFAQGPGHRPRAGLVVADRVLLLDEPVNAVIERYAAQPPDLDALEAERSWVDQDDLVVLAPVEPRQVIQAGANYRTHVLDLAVAHRAEGQTVDQVRQATARMMDDRAAHGVPYLFLGLPTVICAATDDLVLPSYSHQHDWELELAAVVGRAGFRLSPEQATEHVLGWTMVNDITTRDLVFRRDMPEIGTDWFRAKNAPGFLPTGPFIVPTAFVADPQNLQVTLTLNGDVMQDESTADMIFTAAAVVSAASHTVPLMPGDLILTGSPAGNGMHHGRLLRAGDTMECTITGLGVQRTLCVAEALA